MPLECFLLNITLRDLPRKCKKNAENAKKCESHSPPPVCVVRARGFIQSPAPSAGGAYSSGHKDIDLQRGGPSKTHKMPVTNACTALMQTPDGGWHLPPPPPKSGAWGGTFTAKLPLRYNTQAAQYHTWD